MYARLRRVNLRYFVLFISADIFNYENSWKFLSISWLVCVNSTNWKAWAAAVTTTSFLSTSFPALCDNHNINDNHITPFLTKEIPAEQLVVQPGDQADVHLSRFKKPESYFTLYPSPSLRISIIEFVCYPIPSVHRHVSGMGHELKGQIPETQWIFWKY